MNDVRKIVRHTLDNETKESIESLTDRLAKEGLSVEFGKIGSKTNYALIYNEDHSIEYVGYTFCANINYYNENTGKKKALIQAMSRRESLMNQ